MREPCIHRPRASVRPMRRALFLVLTLVAVPALAQEDDDLPALPSAKPKPKPARPKPKPKPKAAPVADDDLPALPQQKGDLVVTAQVVLPKLDDEQRRTLEPLLAELGQPSPRSGS